MSASCLVGVVIFVLPIVVLFAGCAAALHSTNQQLQHITPLAIPTKNGGTAVTP